MEKFGDGDGDQNVGDQRGAMMHKRRLAASPNRSTGRREFKKNQKIAQHVAFDGWLNANRTPKTSQRYGND